MAMLRLSGPTSRATRFVSSPIQPRSVRQPHARHAGSCGERRLLRVAADARRGGGSVLDRPSTTQTNPDKKLHDVRRRPPIYKVMLHNDTYNKRDYVVRVLTRTVEGMTVDDAMVVMQEAHEEGMALVIACSQEEAERYCDTLRLNGLTSTLEPGC